MTTHSVNCKICQNKSSLIFRKKVLGKYDVSYFQCNECSFVQTEDPYWLEEAHSNAIATADIGLVRRNISAEPYLRRLINTYFNQRGKFLDYGGGYGMLTRMMRDNGYDFYNYDTHCENLLAQHFDVPNYSQSEDHFELVTCLEVFEHFSEPVGETIKILKNTDSIFFSTELQPKEGLDDWWYLMPKSGQHISFYSIDSIEQLARRLSLNLYTNNYSYHLLTNREISSVIFKLLFNPKLSFILDTMFKGPSKSLLPKDFERFQ